MRCIVIVGLLLGLLLGPLAVPGVAFASPPLQAEGGEAYSVLKDDWLSKIAEKYYGDALAYPRIVEATNEKAAQDASFTVITDPNLIEVGQMLWIPEKGTTAGESQPEAGLTQKALENAQYQGIYDEPVSLTDGKYEGEPFVEGGASRPTVVFVDLYAFGDLNGDGVDDAAVFLVENSGGSGSFVYLAAVVDQGGLPVNVATQPLGDRVQLRSVAIDAETIVVDVIVQGPDDPACCPTSEVNLTYALQADKLDMVSSQELGKLSPDSLAGTTWVLESYGGYDKPTPVLDDTQITAVFSSEDQQVTGSAGCNNYFASVEGTGTDLTIGPAGATLMACPQPVMDQEQEYLAALQTVSSFQFWSGRLLLMYDGGVLTFKAE